VANGRSRVKLEAAKKRQRVIEARASGHTWRECAALAGDGSSEAAQRAFNEAISRMPQATVEELIRSEEARLEMCDSVLASVIENPPVKTTSIGRTQWDPGTCTCPTRARTDIPHAETCEVKPVLDTGSVVSAVKERRLVGESLRRLRGADRTPAEEILPDLTRELEAAKAYVFQIQDLQRENAALRARLLEAEATPAMILSTSNGDTSPYDYRH
jgi:hypothetical protein